MIKGRPFCYNCYASLLKKAYSLEQICSFITKTGLFKYIENFTTKNLKFSDKNSDIFHISALKNIDCRYSLAPPRWGGSSKT